MSMLAAPDTITGPLTAQDLDRTTNPGNVWLMPRRFEPGQVAADADIEDGWLDSCAPEGGRYAEPVATESMLRHRRIAATVGYALALVAVLTVCAVIGYPL
jgi:hypothetical protein